MRELLLELRKQGTTIFLNSHLLSELEMVCDRVTILVDGLVARQGRLADLTERTIEYRITFTGDAASIREKLTKLGGVVDGGMLVLAGRNTQNVNDAIDLLRSIGLLIESVQPHKFSLEDILVEAPLHVMTAVWMRDLPLSDAVRSHGLALSGNRELCKRLPDWLGASKLAFPPVQ